MESRRNPQLVRSVERAVRICQALFVAPEGRRLAALSEEVGLHKTTALRLLRTLVATGVVRRDEDTETYRWDPVHWLALTCDVQNWAQRGEAARGVLRRLADDAGATAVLAMPEMSLRRMVLVTSVLPQNALRVDLANLRACPMHATACGKALLSGLPEDELQEWVRGVLPAVTESTITDPDEFLAEIRTARARGFAVASQEFLGGVSGVAVPICDDRGKARGAVGLAIAATGISSEDVAAWVQQIRGAVPHLLNLLYALDTRMMAEAPFGDQRAQDAGKQGEPQSETALRGTYRMV